MSRQVHALLFWHLATGIATIAAVCAWIGHPLAGLIPMHDPGSNTWKISASTPDHWPALSIAGLRRHDALISIDGNTWDTHEAALHNALGAGRSTVRVAYRRPDDQTTRFAELPITRYDVAAFADHMSLRIAEGIVIWLLALSVLRAAPNAAANQSLAIALSFFSLVGLTGQQGIGESMLPPLTFGVTVIWAAQTSLIGAAVFGFGATFAQSRGHSHIRRNALLRALRIAAWSISAVIAIGHALSLWVWYSSRAQRAGALANMFLTLDVLSILIGMILMLVVICIGLWLRRAEPAVQTQIRTFAITGIATVLPAVLVGGLTHLTAQAQATVTSLYGFNGRMFYVLGAIGLAHAVIRHQAIVGARKSMAVTTTVAMALLVASLVAWLMRLTGSIAPTQRVPIELLLVATSAMGLTMLSQSSIRLLFGRLIGHDDISFRSVQALGAAMDGLMRHGGSERDLLRAFCNALDLSAAALWLKAEKADTYHLTAHTGLSDNAVQPHVLRDIAFDAQGFESVAWLDASNMPKPLHQTAPQLQGALLLADANEQLAILALGRHNDLEHLNAREIETLRLAGLYVALFMKTARQMHRLEQIPARITETQTRERRRIAQELHDGLIQALGGISLNLASASALISANRTQAAQDILRENIAVVRRSSDDLRRVINDLSSSEVEHGIEAPLRTLIARFEQHSGIDASLDAPAGLDQAMSLNERHQLYRVIRQALDNVADHSQASATTIRISLDDAKLRFEIRDNGLGFSAEDERLAKMRGRMGLISMRERLLGLQGEFTIHSELDHGTSIHGWLPLAG